MGDGSELPTIYTTNGLSGLLCRELKNKRYVYEETLDDGIVHTHILYFHNDLVYEKRVFEGETRIGEVKSGMHFKLPKYVGNTVEERLYILNEGGREFILNRDENSNIVRITDSIYNINYELVR